MNSALDLKPCPCGLPGKIEYDDEFGTGLWHARCSSSQCGWWAGSYDTEAMAREVWNRRPPESGTGTLPREAQVPDPEGERPTYKEIFLKEVWNAFDERHPCFYGDCDHVRGKDCEFAIIDSAREMVKEYFAPPPAEPSNPNPIPQVPAPLPVEPATAPRPDLEAIENSCYEPGESATVESMAITALIAYIRKLESAPGAGIDKGEGT